MRGGTCKKIKRGGRVATLKQRHGGGLQHDDFSKKVILVIVAFGLAYLAIGYGMSFSAICGCVMNFLGTVSKVILPIKLLKTTVDYASEFLLQRSTGETLMFIMLTLFTRGCCRKENAAVSILSACNALKVSVLSTTAVAGYAIFTHFISPEDLMHYLKSAIEYACQFMLAQLFTTNTLLQASSAATEYVLNLLQSNTFDEFIKFANAKRQEEEAKKAPEPPVFIVNDINPEWKAPNEVYVQTAVQRVNHNCGFMQSMRRNSLFIAAGVAVVAVSLTVLSQFSTATLAYAAGGVIISQYGFSFGVSMLYRAIGRLSSKKNTWTQLERVRLILYGLFCTTALCACCLLERNIDLRETIFADILRNQIVRCRNQTRKAAASDPASAPPPAKITEKKLFRDILSNVTSKLHAAMRNKAELAMHIIRLGELMVDVVARGSTEAFLNSEISQTCINVFMGLAGRKPATAEARIVPGTRFATSVCYKLNLANAMIMVRAWIAKVFCDKVAVCISNTRITTCLQNALEEAISEIQDVIRNRTDNTVVHHMIDDEVHRLQNKSLPNLRSLKRTAGIVLSQPISEKYTEITNSIHVELTRTSEFEGEDELNEKEIVCKIHKYEFTCFEQMDMNIYQLAVFKNFASMVQAGTKRKHK